MFNLLCILVSFNITINYGNYNNFLLTNSHDFYGNFFEIFNYGVFFYRFLILVYLMNNDNGEGVSLNEIHVSDEQQ